MALVKAMQMPHIVCLAFRGHVTLSLGYPKGVPAYILLPGLLEIYKSPAFGQGILPE